MGEIKKYIGNLQIKTMSFASRFLKGEVTLLKSFWFVSIQPFLAYVCGIVYEILIPRPIYPYAYSFYSLITRLVSYEFFMLFVLSLLYGTWKATNQYEGAKVWKWLARLVLTVNLVIVLLAMLFTAIELSYIDSKYYPYELDKPR